MYQDALALQVLQQVQLARLPNGYALEPIIDEASLAKLTDTFGIYAKDYRARNQREDGFGSVFEGLAFEPGTVRSQTVAVCYEATPIATMSIVIAPCKWIARQRYFQQSVGGIIVRDFQTYAGAMPNFVIIPAWTMVYPQYSKDLAVAGFRVFYRAINLLKENAPCLTYIEAIAQGVGIRKRSFYEELSNREVGSFIKAEEFDTPLEHIGIPYAGSIPSVKMAKVLGLIRVDGYGSSVSLGPVFYARVR